MGIVRVSKFPWRDSFNRFLRIWISLPNVLYMIILLRHDCLRNSIFHNNMNLRILAKINTSQIKLDLLCYPHWQGNLIFFSSFLFYQLLNYTKNFLKEKHITDTKISEKIEIQVYEKTLIPLLEKMSVTMVTHSKDEVMMIYQFPRVKFWFLMCSLWHFQLFYCNIFIVLLYELFSMSIVLYFTFSACKKKHKHLKA